MAVRCAKLLGPCSVRTGNKVGEAGPQYAGRGCFRADDVPVVDIQLQGRIPARVSPRLQQHASNAFGRND